MMVISVMSNKGGTGKTTTSVNLSASLAKQGFNVLLVDLDPQGYASVSLGIPYAELSPSSAEVLFDGVKIESVIRDTAISGMDLITGGIELANSDLILADMPDRENRLDRALQHIRTEYDFIILDCPPSLSLVLVNALTAADRYIIPITPDYLALEGLITLLSTVKKIKNEMGLDIELLGILFTMVNLDRLRVRRQEFKMQLGIIKLLREHYSKDVFKTFIIRDARLSETASYGQTIFDFAPNSKVALGYMRLANEVKNLCGKTNREGIKSKNRQVSFNG